ncbi:histidine utilization repressor [Ferrimonas marina]|uniref:Histidine utilization repressor n=1 Tax=Ferrimonas marina TaxID=299255 RepID=A0A1M5XNR4_9GAMM|nr:histidine utilization repressor [Ferrimonas marina]SHI01292.1 GntR family transcriptional regulator, histidine utilization repressor [Ferrimonas marina]
MIAKFESIKRAIREKIAQGEWGEQHRLPSENALAQQYGCSRMTARRALTELVEQGLLTRAQGLGTFVAPFQSQGSMMAIRNIADEIRQRGHRHRAELLLLEPQPAQPEAAIALGLAPGETLYRSCLVHLENESPVQLEDRFVNPALVPDYLAQPFEQQTPHEYLCQVAPLTQAHHLIEAVTPSMEQCRLLALASSEPCLQIQRRTWSAQGVVSYARLLHPGSRFRLGGHLMVESE